MRPNIRGFEQTYPLKSEVRSQKLSSLRAQYDQSSRTLSHTFTAQRAHEWSLRVAWTLGNYESLVSEDNLEMVIH